MAGPRRVARSQRGTLYPRRKPHPPAPGEWLFVMVTWEASLLKRQTLPSALPLRCSYPCCQQRFPQYCLQGLAVSVGVLHIFSSGEVHSRSRRCPASPIRVLSCDQLKTWKCCYVKNRRSSLSPFVCGPYLYSDHIKAAVYVLSLPTVTCLGEERKIT